jgi:uncharacterized protein (TIGR00369 family)
MSDPQSYFNRMQRGELPPPSVFTLLGGVICGIDALAGTWRVDYMGTSNFLNPAGLIQGGMLCAMLDDLTASHVDSTLVAGEYVTTLNLNVSFLRPAQPGLLHGESNLVRRGREICHVSAVLTQDDKIVASAVATCKVMK